MVQVRTGKVWDFEATEVFQMYGSAAQASGDIQLTHLTVFTPRLQINSDHKERLSWLNFQHSCCPSDKNFHQLSKATTHKHTDNRENDTVQIKIDFCLNSATLFLCFHSSPSSLSLSLSLSLPSTITNHLSSPSSSYFFFHLTFTSLSVGSDSLFWRTRWCCHPWN